MSALRFERAQGGRLKIGEDALRHLRSHAQNQPGDLEAGGVLLGRHILRTEDIVIDALTEPLPGDRRAPCAFYRHREGHQALIDAAWKESDGTCVYLGEWHTHPEDHPFPSATDVREWKRKLREDVVDAETVFFVIVGMREIRVWEGSLGDGGIWRLKALG